MRRLISGPQKRTFFGDTLLVGALTAVAKARGLVNTVIMATIAASGALLDSWLSCVALRSKLRVLAAVGAT